MTKPSLLYWIVAALLLLWNGYGVYDFTMTQLQNEAHLAAYPDALVDYWRDFPLWVNASWGLAVWGAFIGAILLLLRKRLAVTAFTASFVGFVLTTLYSIMSGGMALQAEYMGAAAHVFTIVIFGLAVFSIWWSMRARKRGIIN